MAYIHFKPPLKIKSALVAGLFIAAQLPFGLAGGRVFAAEVADQASQQATQSIKANQPENPGQQNETNGEEQGPTNPVALEAIQQNPENEHSPENQPPENKPDTGQPASVVEQLTALSQNVSENNIVTTNENEDQDVTVTLCHTTGSSTNSFVKITVSASGAFNGHLGSDHQNGEDIIPPFTFNGHSYSQNWNTAGQTTFNNNCTSPTGGGGGGQEDNVTLCHATGSATNPFVRITVSAAGAFNGHLGSSHQNGEDIIPPFTFNGQTYSQNWDAAGQATFNNGCVVPAGGQGGGENNGQVLGASTTTPSGGQGAGEALVNTGSNVLLSIIVSLTTIGLTAEAHLLTRKQYV